MRKRRCWACASGLSFLLSLIAIIACKMNERSTTKVVHSRSFEDLNAIMEKPFSALDDHLPDPVNFQDIVAIIDETNPKSSSELMREIKQAIPSFFDGFSLVHSPSGCNQEKLANKANPRLILHGNPKARSGQGYLYLAITPGSKRIEFIEFHPKYQFYSPHLVEFGNEEVRSLDDEKELATCRSCHTGRPKKVGSLANDIYAFRPNWGNYRAWENTYGFLHAFDGFFEGEDDSTGGSAQKSSSRPAGPSPTSLALMSYQEADFKAFIDKITEDSIFNLLDRNRLHYYVLSSMNASMNTKFTLRNSERIANLILNGRNFEKLKIDLFKVAFNQVSIFSNLLDFPLSSQFASNIHSTMQLNQRADSSLCRAQLREEFANASKFLSKKALKENRSFLLNPEKELPCLSADPSFLVMAEDILESNGAGGGSIVESFHGFFYQFLPPSGIPMLPIDGSGGSHYLYRMFLSVFIDKLADLSFSTESLQIEKRKMPLNEIAHSDLEQSIGKLENRRKAIEDGLQNIDTADSVSRLKLNKLKSKFTRMP